MARKRKLIDLIPGDRVCFKREVVARSGFDTRTANMRGIIRTIDQELAVVDVGDTFIRTGEAAQGSTLPPDLRVIPIANLKHCPAY